MLRLVEIKISVSVMHASLLSVVSRINTICLTVHDQYFILRQLSGHINPEILRGFNNTGNVCKFLMSNLGCHRTHNKKQLVYA